MLKRSIFSIKTCVFVNAEGQKNDYFRNLFRIISQNSKHVLCRVLYKYGKYCVLIDSKLSRNICFDSVFNRIFDYIHGTHCLTGFNEIVVLDNDVTPTILVPNVRFIVYILWLF